jgi:hypothetical protein
MYYCKENLRMEKRKNKNGPSYSFDKPSFLYGEIELYSNHLRGTSITLEPPL